MMLPVAGALFVKTERRGVGGGGEWAGWGCPWGSRVEPGERESMALTRARMSLETVAGIEQCEPRRIFCTCAEEVVECVRSEE